MTSQESYRLFQQMKADDKKAFETLFYTYYEEMCQFSYRIIRCKQTVEELVSDVFYTIWKNRNSLNIEDVGAYLYVSVKNESIRFLKKEIRFSGNFSQANELIADSSTPETNLLFSELQESYDNAYNNLSGQPKKVYYLHKSCNKSYKEISAELNLSVKTVENHMASALRQIRESLASYRLDNVK
ncbi:RNA polymerase sigma factor [Fulvivirga lutea]|uniref:RNA polymerase sigma-70 factor n=1 Tax=Fulvivirga lutea TaxID=2810512 RepID=A0A974WEJ7_9BACT|nr:RNA polymerase sigma-70 factor [Fulvivirga lutea]QSE96169.1 RNA polymerase sigma-70 factor [Fulvivirga lutea]